MGVSYRLLAMFMLAPEEKRTTSLVAFCGGVAALVLVLAGGITAVLLGYDPETLLLASAALAVLVLALYGGDVARLYRQRKRRKLETNSLMAAPALVSLGLGAVLLIVMLALGRLPDTIGPIVYLFAFGWLGGLGLAQLYKIVAFVTWL
jgi:cation transport ATPase